MCIACLWSQPTFLHITIRFLLYVGFISRLLVPNKFEPQVQECNETRPRWQGVQSLF